ncbi:hypothetical protein GUJ93_ZPchr0015g6900 [Zizania palustris]|uniref:Uncharacterized protein n=1 Tax=Zizania palustris TaxID=103762 RepID=A0A8J5TI19_ZIZPA|nr:hypothetical protein GUJ93_ZPchr0015g6900 [Zizania palustris]
MRANSGAGLQERNDARKRTRRELAVALVRKCSSAQKCTGARAHGAQKRTGAQAHGSMPERSGAGKE